MYLLPRSSRRAAAAAGAVLLLGALLAGCSTHDEAVSRPCPEVTSKKVAAISNRGAIGMAKIGLTPDNLKAREDCK